MNAPLFDTHQMVKRLIAAGFSDNQAETVTDVVREARQFDLENLVVKADLADLKSELRADLAEVRSEVRAEIADVRSDLREVNVSLRAEMAAVRAEMQIIAAKTASMISESRAETLRGVIGLMIAQTGLIVPLTKVLQTP